MSVRRPPSVVSVFMYGAFLGNRMPYLDDIWYVGGARAKDAHAEFWVWHMLIKYLICMIYAKHYAEHFSGPVCPHLDDIWYVGRARVKDVHVEF